MSEEYATTRQDFLTATASYLGLPLDSVSNDSELKTDDAGMMVAVLHVWLKPSDIIGIGKRMQEIAKEQGDIVEIHTEPPTMPDNAALRAEYDGLTQADKGRFGSFGKYVTWRMMNDKPVTQAERDNAQVIADGILGNMPATRQVTHVDAPEEPEPTNMDAVWLWANEVLDAQRPHAVDYKQDSYGAQYLINWAMLTDEQKQKAGKP